MNGTEIMGVKFRKFQYSHCHWKFPEIQAGIFQWGINIRPVTNKISSFVNEYSKDKEIRYNQMTWKNVKTLNGMTDSLTVYHRIAVGLQLISRPPSFLSVIKDSWYNIIIYVQVFHYCHSVNYLTVTLL